MPDATRTRRTRKVQPRVLPANVSFIRPPRSTPDGRIQVLRQPPSRPPPTDFTHLRIGLGRLGDDLVLGPGLCVGFPNRSLADPVQAKGADSDAAARMLHRTACPPPGTCIDIAPFSIALRPGFGYCLPARRYDLSNPTVLARGLADDYPPEVLPLIHEALCKVTWGRMLLPPPASPQVRGRVPLPSSPLSSGLLDPDLPHPIRASSLKYYIDADEGSDANDGSWAYPWKSLWWVRSMLVLGEARPGDRFHFRRGCTWSVDTEEAAYCHFALRFSCKYGVMAPPMLAEVQASFFHTDVRGYDTRVLLPILCSGSEEEGTLVFEAYGDDGDDPTFEGNIPERGSPIGDFTTGASTDEVGPGWPVAASFDDVDEDWVGLYVEDQSWLEFWNIRIKGFYMGADIAGACTDLTFGGVTFETCTDKGCTVHALEGDSFSYYWDGSTVGTFRYIAAYEWEEGYYPDRITFSGCTFTEIGAETDANALLLNQLCTNVTVTECTFEWCVDGVDIHSTGSGILIEGNLFTNGLLAEGTERSDGDGLDVIGPRPRTRTSWLPDPVTGALPLLDDQAAVDRSTPLKTVFCRNTFRLLPGRAMEIHYAPWYLEIYDNLIEDCHIGIRIAAQANDVLLHHYRDLWNPGGATLHVVEPASLSRTGSDTGWTVIDAPLDPWQWLASDGTMVLRGGLLEAREINIYRNIFCTTEDIDTYYEEDPSRGRPGQEAAILLYHADKDCVNRVLALVGETQYDFMRYTGVRVLNNTISGVRRGDWTDNNTGLGMKLVRRLDESVAAATAAATSYFGTLSADEKKHVEQQSHLTRLFSDLLVANNIFSDNDGYVDPDETAASGDEVICHWLLDGLTMSPWSPKVDATNEDTFLIERNWYSACLDCLGYTDRVAYVKIECSGTAGAYPVISPTLADLQHLFDIEVSWGSGPTIPPGDPRFLGGSSAFELDASSPCIDTALTSSVTFWLPRHERNASIARVPHHETGYEVPLTDDFDGHPNADAPDIGAQEMQKT